FFFSQLSLHHHNLHSLPTRRSSDLMGVSAEGFHACPRSNRAALSPRHTHTLPRLSACKRRNRTQSLECFYLGSCASRILQWRGPDRKSTRLNSSHQIISYAVFCLKK